MKKIRTRYAPSPTGYLHIGGARTALFAYLYAKHFNGDFIVRTEDTDIKRNVVGGEDSQLDNLIWLGIIPDESPRNPVAKYGKYRQSEKLERYNKIIEQLLKEGKVYKAYDSSEELAAQREAQAAKGIFSFRYDANALTISDKEKQKRDDAREYSIRLKLPEDKWYVWKDMVRGKISVNTKDIGDFVIKKKDGYPTYNFAVVVDDHDMEITHVHRGEEHTTNTPKQLAIYDLLDWEAPEFAHLTIITNMDGKKLSKRDLSVRQFINDYKNEGYNSEALLNFLALLGWTHPEAKEVMTKTQIIEAFTSERFSKSSSKFDSKKMDWFSKEYIKHLPNNLIVEKLTTGNHDAKWLDLFIETYKQNAITYTMIQKALAIYDNKEVKAIESTFLLKTFAEEILKRPFEVEQIQEAINSTKKITKVKGKDLFMPLREVTTYEEHGPELAKAIYLVGEELTKKRLRKLLGE